MKVVCFLSLFLVFFAEAKAQKKYYFSVQGEKGEVLTTVDSLAFEDPMRTSYFYIDSLTQKPYSGNAVIHYSKNNLDSISLEEGYQQGWEKSIHINGNTYIENEFTYADQNKRLFVSYSPVSPLRNVFAFARYYTDTARFFHEVIYKSCGKIIVKQSVQTTKGQKKNRYKFSALDELDNFFKPQTLIYSYCKQAGFFGEPEIK